MLTYDVPVYWLQYSVYTGPNQTWEIGRVSIKTRRYVGNREEKITTDLKNCLV